MFTSDAVVFNGKSNGFNFKACTEQEFNKNSLCYQIEFQKPALAPENSFLVPGSPIAL